MLAQTVKFSLFLLHFGFAVFAVFAAESKQASHHQPRAEDGHHKQHWSYAGKAGPSRWADLTHGYSTCGVGKQQSPIDFSAVAITSMPAIKVHYQETPLIVKNNGHTIQVDVSPGSYIEIAQRRYELVQFHFHSPSEHSFAGKSFPMVAHLVHKDYQGKLAVIAVMMENGGLHPLIEQIWSNMPMRSGKINRGNKNLNAADLLPDHLSYLHYTGSLTTPPCTEGVKWYVLTDAVSIAAKQVQAFVTLFPRSTRPPQPLNGRAARYHVGIQ